MAFSVLLQKRTKKNLSSFFFARQNDDDYYFSVFYVYSVSFFNFVCSAYKFVSCDENH